MPIEKPTTKMTHYRWSICTLLFFATTINYLDRQVLSLTWKDFLVPEFHWNNNDYGTITAIFSLAYAFSMLLAGRFIDWMDTKKGMLWAIGIWSVGACLHAFCGIVTAGVLTDKWIFNFHIAAETLTQVDNIAKVISVSVTFFIFVRIILAFGEAGNFPGAIKATAEYFPQKDRALSTSIFNAGATIGAMLAPLSIPYIAAKYGWEMAFIIIGATGFLWMIFWIFMYKKPEQNLKVNQQELAYIQQDEDQSAKKNIAKTPAITWKQAFQYKQTWAFVVGKFFTDGVWWFFLFWTPAYLSDVYGLSAMQSAPELFVLYSITLLSIIGGWLPTYFIEKKQMTAFAGRRRAMLIFAFVPLLTLLAQPLGNYSVWFPVIIIGIGGAAHQAWSANIFSTVGDMFPKTAIATIVGIGGMAGGVGSFLINKGSGVLFDYAKSTNLSFMGFEGVKAGYFMVFIFCGVAYLISWLLMKKLVPFYQPVKI